MLYESGEARRSPPYPQPHRRPARRAADDSGAARGVGGRQPADRRRTGTGRPLSKPRPGVPDLRRLRAAGGGGVLAHSVRALVHRALLQTDATKEAKPMSSSTTQTDPTLIDRYQNFRTQRFLKYERTYAHSLPRWRTQGRRRALVAGLAATFAFMAVVSVMCAFGIRWAPLLWLPACAVLLPAAGSCCRSCPAGRATHHRRRSTSTRCSSATPRGLSG